MEHSNPRRGECVSGEGTNRYWWTSQCDELRERFRTAVPFPHVVIDDFLEPERGRGIIAAEYGDVGSPRWTYHRHYSQCTYSRTDVSTYGAVAAQVVAFLGAPEFLRFLTALTGIEGLFLDPDLEDGGITACRHGGFANIHTDMTVHPAKPYWKRRINLLWYLNVDWQPLYRGELELWDAEVRHCVRRIQPLFNRCVIFEVSERALHGYPERLQYPPDNPRKCMAFYYFTEESTRPRRRYFEYHARPGEGLKHLWVAVDNVIIHTYERLRKPLGIDDRAINRVMRALGMGRR
jgi:hypothetical protein